MAAVTAITAGALAERRAPLVMAAAHLPYPRNGRPRAAAAPRGVRPPPPAPSSAPADGSRRPHNDTDWAAFANRLMRLAVAEVASLFCVVG